MSLRLRQRVRPATAPRAGLSIGGHRLDYPGHIWHYPMSRIVAAARAAGLQAMDGPFGSYTDLEGVRASAQMARILGYDGKWAVHPAQIDVINDVLTPSDELLRQARVLAKRYREPQEGDGPGVVAMDGEMVGAAEAGRGAGGGLRGDGPASSARLSSLPPPLPSPFTRNLP